MFVKACALSFTLNLGELIALRHTYTDTHTHTHSLHLLAAGLIAWKMNTKCRAKWMAWQGSPWLAARCLLYTGMKLEHPNAYIPALMFSAEVRVPVFTDMVLRSKITVPSFST